MIDTLYAVHDLKAGHFEPPFTSVNSSTAIRVFLRMLNGIPTMHDHPSDFVLFEIGAYTTESGLVEPLVPPKLVIGGLECVEAFKDDERTNDLLKQAARAQSNAPVQQGTEGGDTA